MRFYLSNHDKTGGHPCSLDEGLTAIMNGIRQQKEITAFTIKLSILPEEAPLGQPIEITFYGCN